MKIHISFLVLLLIAFSVGKPVDESKENLHCGYGSCHPVNETILNLHLVPHSHDDVGWLKTVDQYFYGYKTQYQYAGVQYIIGSVVQSLQMNPDRRFIQVETAFFWQWWKQQSNSTRETVQQLVNAGRLEIINGAWSMNDEAAAHYHSIIDQFTWGLRTINDTLGVCGRPKIGWQIDPFGHSREMASIFSQLGYDGLFFARLDYRDSELRHKTKNLETMWQGSPSLGANSNLFTGVLYDFYSTPAYFCWDMLCSDVPINDDLESPDFNQDKIVQRFAEYAVKGAQYYATNHLLITMGGDFTYQAAEMFYINMDKLIAGFKKYRPDINIIYSTPSCYLKAVNIASKKLAFPVKTDDFFPLASATHSYWTGYYTSRPNSKRFERQGNNLLQVTKQMSALTKSSADDLVLLKEAMGIMQHHDAITGTEKQHVTDDYVRLMTKAIERAQVHINTTINNLLGKSSGIPKITYESCLLSNVSYCRTSKEDEFTVAVYNPLSHNVSHYIQIPVDGNRFNITGVKGNITYSLMPAMANFATSHKVSSSPNNLIFKAELPAIGFSYFHIKKLPALQKPIEEDNLKVEQRIDSLQFFGTKQTGIKMNMVTGYLAEVTLNGITIPVKQDFLYYRGANGTNLGENNRASGAYIFRPVPNTTAIPISEKVKITVTKNAKHVTEVHQEFSSWIKQIIRIYKNESYIEFDWMVGPIKTALEGVEVITRFTTNLANNATFYTDSNGREMIERIRNYRSTFNYTNEEPISGNYYPVTSRIAIKDLKNNVELSLLNDRAQGGSSLKDGEVELMLHRRLLNDDDFGVGEALMEEEFGHGVMVRGQIYLVLANITKTNNNSALITHDVAQRKLLAPWSFIGQIKTKTTVADLVNKLYFQQSFLTRELPTNIQILSLEPWKNNRLLLRLENIFAKNEHPILSKPTTISIDGLFKNIKISQAFETTLGANQWLEENEKLQWNLNNKNVVTQLEDSHSSQPTQERRTERIAVNLKNITLGPMEIRTFICYLA